jgi:hypothetical protein
MVLKTWQSLVLHGVNVINDVTTGMVRSGSKSDQGQAPAYLSPSRHEMPCLVPNRSAPASRYDFAERCGKDTAAARAGRPEGQPGVLVRRSPALSARPTILAGWSEMGKGSPMIAAC